MNRCRSIGSLVVGGLGLLVGVAGARPAPAQPATTTIEGVVVAAHGRWTADHRNLLTDAVVRTAAGDADVIELGGHADGLTMTVIHGPTQLEPGQRVTVTVHATAASLRDRTARPRWLVDDVELDADAAGAAPYVRTPTNKSLHPVYWAKSCVQVSRASEGTTAIAGDGEVAVITASLGVWNTASAGCSYLNLVDRGTHDGEVGNDGVNLIKFRDREWCRPAVDGNEVHCFSHQAAAITTLVFIDDPANARDGEIIDADIELNGVDFAIATNGQSESPAGCQADLGNTLVHELGHLVGLGHTCLGPAEAPRLDGAGRPVPLCSETTDPVIIDATMYPFQSCGETSKTSLSADDTAGLCAIYPKANDPGVCAGPDALGGGCCDHGGGGARGPLIPGLLLALGLASARRRRSAPRRSPARP